MNFKDAHSGMQLVKSIGNAVYTADQAGAIINHQGFRSVTYALEIGIGGITFDGSNKIEFFLEHGNASDLSDAALVALGDVLGLTSISSGILKSLIVAHAAANVYRFGYRGGKQYSRLTANFTGTHGTGTPIAAMAILSRPDNGPVAAQA